jgi:hypothetical protein
MRIKCPSQLGLLLCCKTVPPSPGISRLCTAHLSGSSKRSIAPHCLFPSPHFVNMLVHHVCQRCRRPQAHRDQLGHMERPTSCAHAPAVSSLRSTPHQCSSCSRPAPTRTRPSSRSPRIRRRSTSASASTTMPLLSASTLHARRLPSTSTFTSLSHSAPVSAALRTIPLPCGTSCLASTASRSLACDLARTTSCSLSQSSRTSRSRA